MPSPIAHTTMGYAIYKMCQPRRPQPGLGWIGRFPRFLLVTAGLSLLPDLDSVAGILSEDFGRYHNNGMHSLFVGLALALVVGSLVWWRKRSGFIFWFAVVLLCYDFHIILDFFTFGRGVMLFWPLSSARFEAPVKLFHGLHWSEEIFSIHHVLTLLNELGFAILVAFAIHFLERKTSYFRPAQQSLGQPSERIPKRG